MDDPRACNAASLFDMIWESLVDVLGSAGTATLIMRSRKIAGPNHHQLEQLQVTRTGFEYAYQVPDAWKHGGAEALTALRMLARELGPLLRQLTGPVVVQRLNKIEELKHCEVFFEQERPS